MLYVQLKSTLIKWRKKKKKTHHKATKIQIVNTKPTLKKLKIKKKHNFFLHLSELNSYLNTLNPEGMIDQLKGSQKNYQSHQNRSFLNDPNPLSLWLSTMKITRAQQKMLNSSKTCGFWFPGRLSQSSKIQCWRETCVWINASGANIASEWML